MRDPAAPLRRKVKTGVSLDPGLYAWVLARVGPGRRFSSVTHALECGIVALQERDAREGAPAVAPASAGGAPRTGR